MLKTPISEERYQQILEYNRIYYASMSLEKKQELLAIKKLYNKIYRERQSLLRKGNKTI
jgi:hypothetical protein